MACGRGSGHAERPPPCGHRVRRDHGGAASPGLPTDKVSRGRWCEHHGGSGSTPDKVAVAGAHPSGRSTFQGGSDEVLQLEAETREVRDHPSEEKGARGSGSPSRGKMAAAAA
jgi:hypothetical protein